MGSRLTGIEVDSEIRLKHHGKVWMLEPTEYNGMKNPQVFIDDRYGEKLSFKCSPAEVRKGSGARKYRERRTLETKNKLKSACLRERAIEVDRQIRTLTNNLIFMENIEAFNGISFYQLFIDNSMGESVVFRARSEKLINGSVKGAPKYRAKRMMETRYDAWTEEKVTEEASKYKTRAEFKEKSGSAYARARKTRILDKICSHMERVGNRYNRYIYSISLEQTNEIYIGLSYNPKKRFEEHKLRGKLSVKRIIQEGAIFTILAGPLSQKDAATDEQKCIEQYKEAGWLVLNTAKGGGLGTPDKKDWMPFDKAQEFVHSLKITTSAEWGAYIQGERSDLPAPPGNLPFDPRTVYLDSGWDGYGDWLGTGIVPYKNKEYKSYDEAKIFVHPLAKRLKIDSVQKWRKFARGDYAQLKKLPDNIPSTPDKTYKNAGWLGWGDWLGTGTVAPGQMVYRSYPEAKDFVRTLGLKSMSDWGKFTAGKDESLPIFPQDIPKAPHATYKDQWENWGEWLGTGTIAVFNRIYRPYESSKEFIHTLRLKSGAQWSNYLKGQYPNLPPLPKDISRYPHITYKNKGWKGMGDWLGTYTIATRDRKYIPYQEAQRFIHSLNLKNYKEWKKYCKGHYISIPPLSREIPSNPNITYAKEWKGWPAWLCKKKAK